MDRQQLESGNELLTVSGRVINPTSSEQDVPPLQAQLRTKTGKVVYSWVIAPPAPSLAAGASAPFNSAEINVPPGGDELPPEGVEALDAFLEEHLDADAVRAMHTLYERFEASRAPLGPHYYLSLLATHPEHRGKGVGQALLADNLSAWDDAGAPAYLESTNPANDHRYARAGFRPIGGFQTVLDRAWVSAMWRDVGGAPASIRG